MRPSLQVLFVAGVLVPTALATAAEAKPRVFSTTDAGIVYATSFVLDAGATYQMWTRGTSTGGDPVMHLKGQQPDTTYAYEASNDDWQVGRCVSAPSAGMVASDACIEYTNTTGADQAASLLVHAYRRAVAGTTLLTVRKVGGATLLSQGIAFAGDAIQSVGGDPVEWNAFERLDYAYSLTGIVFPRVVALRSSEEPIRSATKNFNGSIYAGLWGQPRLQLPVASAGPPGAGKGGPMFVVGSVYATKGYGDGSARMYLNDVYTDTDGDGLGDGLEAALGTCAAAGQGCDDPTDSDEDGFYDALEVIGGAHHPDCAQLDPGQGPTDYDAGRGCSINLGTYGADPLERDIFVQLNWMRDSSGADPYDGGTVDLAQALATVQERFSSSKTVFDVDKPSFQLHIDYGQWEHFDLGGAALDYQYKWCYHATSTGQCDDFESLWAECPAGSSTGEGCYGCPASNPDCGCPDGPSDCCSAHAGRGCSDAACESAICALDPPCCDTAWDQACSDAANDQCAVCVDCICADSDYNGAGNPGRCLPRDYVDADCDTVCERYDANHLAPDGADPHAPSNTFEAYWGTEPLFPVNRRGLFLPAVIVQQFGEMNGAGICVALSCDVENPQNPATYAGEKRIVPGIIAMKGQPTVAKMATTFMHELGHQLGLPHAPHPDVDNHQPNHVSTMNYTYGSATNTVTPDGRPDFSHVRPTVQAASHIITEVTEAVDCDPADTVNCPQGLAQDATCNVWWSAESGRCYAGGLDERVGIGSNPTPAGAGASDAWHAHVVSKMDCAGTPGYVAGQTLQFFPDNIDWNSNNIIPFVVPSEVPPPDPAEWSNPAENLSFRVLFDPADAKCAKGDPGDPVTSLEVPDEWKLVCDELPLSRQGRGVPLFCDQTFGCPSPLECVCGWCVPDGELPPQNCLDTLGEGEPTCDDGLQ